MSAQSQNPDSIYTQQVKQLINMISPLEAGYGSVFEDARHYFSLTPSLENHIEDLKVELKKIKGNKQKEILCDQLTKQIKNSTEKLELINHGFHQRKEKNLSPFEIFKR